MPIIKRYANRKLYDTHAKRYVTLPDIAGMVRRGDDVTVLDHASGEDITSQVQAQIIFEQERQARGGLPSAVLTGLIQASNETLNQLRQTLLPLDRNARLDSEIERRIRTLVESGELSERQGSRLLAKLLSVNPPSRGGALEVLRAEQQALERLLHVRGTPTRDEIQELSQRIKDLSTELQALNTTARASKRVKKRRTTKRVVSPERNKPTRDERRMKKTKTGD